MLTEPTNDASTSAAALYVSMPEGHSIPTVDINVISIPVQFISLFCRLCMREDQVGGAMGALLDPYKEQRVYQLETKCAKLEHHLIKLEV